jgi:hypothetical protein
MAMGDNGGALEMFNKCLAIHEKELGKEHPASGNSYDNIEAVMWPSVTWWCPGNAEHNSCDL